jgi:hypothetical protein
VVCASFGTQILPWHILTPCDRYIPPKLKHDKSNIKNSENTVLFLLSCFEYILAGVVLNAGPPFRQKALQNCKSTRSVLDLLDTLTTIEQGRSYPP